MGPRKKFLTLYTNLLEKLFQSLLSFIYDWITEILSIFLCTVITQLNFIYFKNCKCIKIDLKIFFFESSNIFDFYSRQHKWPFNCTVSMLILLQFEDCATALVCQECFYAIYLFLMDIRVIIDTVLIRFKIC